MGLFWNMMRFSSAASQATGRNVYSAVQGMMANRQTKKLCKEATEANFRNRAVAVMPGMDKHQLLLTSGESSDNDVYDYQSASSTAALDYICGGSGNPGNVVVSGGGSLERARATVPFIHLCQAQGTPVVILHTGDDDLLRAAISHSVCHQFISRADCYYDVFRGVADEDAAALLYETMPRESATPAAEALLRALVMVVSAESRVTVPELAGFPLMDFKSRASALRQTGELSDDEYNDATQYYLSGSSAIGAVRLFLTNLRQQMETVYGRSMNSLSNMHATMNRKGVIAIDVGTARNDLLIALVLNHLILLKGSYGERFAVLFDNIPFGAHADLLTTLINGIPHAISCNDLFSTVAGNGAGSDSLFTEIIGGVDTTVLFRHPSGTSCKKWSDHIGSYRKIRARYNIGRSDAFMGVNVSQGMSLDETDEPRIRAETLGKLPDGVACICGADSGILIARVEEA